MNEDTKLLDHAELFLSVGALIRDSFLRPLNHGDYLVPPEVFGRVKSAYTKLASDATKALGAPGKVQEGAKLTVYSLSSDTEEEGMQCEVFTNPKDRQDRLVKIMKASLDEETDNPNLAQIIRDHIDSGLIETAWEVWSDHFKPHLDTYSRYEHVITLPAPTLQNRVFVHVNGGVVQAVFADDANIQITVIDDDNGEQDDEVKAKNEQLMEVALTLPEVL